MTSLEKIIHLTTQSEYDCMGDEGRIFDGIDLSKVDVLGQGTKHDICTSSSTKRIVNQNEALGYVTRSGICHSFTANGRCVSMFKTLFTNYCTHDCKYCQNSTEFKRNKTIYSYTPEELARITISLYKGNYIEGLFLSSGISSDENLTTEKMLETLKILKEKYNFAGYIHFKVLPGVSYEYIKQASEMADRLSVNIETPSNNYLSELSSTKNYVKDILKRQYYIKKLEIKKELPAGQTTQLVVGACGESDFDIFKRVLKEYEEMMLKRVYYSVFNPVPGTSLEDINAQPTWREHRLYQMDWLYRVYSFSEKEIKIAFDEEGFLNNKDPKLYIALNTLDSGVDPNEASYDELLRVPGIGPKSAYRIVNYRKKNKIYKREQLQNLGVRTKNATPFLKINGTEYSRIDRWIECQTQ
ncbi:MAG: biotin synthase [Candidatus Methanofastidiosum methylothiophilum]|uniref:Biotin synthase n=1 Tax=Candidatus Methanofastidiosum methylothiophilum TaxID=1705564 RepID=A0A150J167_9EURY|nr:MAG: biotin synthase [Candidatus Methanofastidiosum methylthiophilus]KYC48170.1 MAG: biotin synthase [Candidatus Methanofastidiosum methylthiophilus]KYC50825.1 MAG: biotin synthase [Candidatus Methanofastidiosum methylthiophilus]